MSLWRRDDLAWVALPRPGVQPRVRHFVDAGRSAEFPLLDWGSLAAGTYRLDIPVRAEEESTTLSAVFAVGGSEIAASADSADPAL